jgi:transposase
VCGRAYRTFYDQRPRRVRDLSCGDKRVYLEVPIRRVWCSRCGGVKREQLEFLADNPLYTKRFAFFVGRRCRESTIKAVAEELHLHWHTVKELDKQYMREQLRRAGSPAPRVIGIDEISVATHHRYRIVVSNLERGRPIWFGGKDRSEASLDEFFAWLGLKKSRKIRLAVMDMWKAFRKSTLKEGHAPQARIVYDKFHVLGHLGKAMDKVRKQEYARLSGKDRRFIKGQKYHLLTRWENLTCGITADLPGLVGSLTTGGVPSGGNAWSHFRSLPTWSKLTGTASRPTATWRTRCPWDLSRDSTTKSVPCNVGPTAIAMRSTSD